MINGNLHRYHRLGVINFDGLNENEINHNSFVDEYKMKNEKEECCICMDEFKEKDKIRRLPCLHIFHEKEIDLWLNSKNECPICRQPVKQ